MGASKVADKSKRYAIKVKNLTKDYGKGRGNFDISFSVNDGEAFGLVGENGAGKTTLIRELMGFIKPNKGGATIYGLDAQKQAAQTKNLIGYVPGEINFPDLKSGTAFLKDFAAMRGFNDFTYSDAIIKRLQLDIRAYPRRMSKGMKQKTAIVTALMTRPKLIILDEPTTGLDPLMRDELLTILKEEKARGATILMSSNTYEELETVCDKVALITKGHLVDIADVNALKKRNRRDLKIEFKNKEDFNFFLQQKFPITRVQENYLQVTIRIPKSQIATLLKVLARTDVKFIAENAYTLETYFQEQRRVTP